MSRPAGGILGHLCTCGHPATAPWHPPERIPDRIVGTRPGACRMTGCPCLLAQPRAESVVIPAYDDDGNRLCWVLGPGEGSGELQSCACASCRELWLTCRPRPDADVDDLFGEVGA